MPDPERVDTPVPAVVTVQKGKLIIASEPVGITEAKRKEFAKVATALGFVHQPDGHWILEREFDLSKLCDPIEKLERLGWHVLPEATGYLDSYLAHVRLHAAQLRLAAASTNAAAAADRQRVVNATNSPEFIERIRAQFNPGLHQALNAKSTAARPDKSRAVVRLEKQITESGRIGEVLVFKLSSAHPQADIISAAYQGRLISSNLPNQRDWLTLELPTDEDIRLAKRCAGGWGLSGQEELPEV